MYLKQLSILNYKNIASAELHLEEGVCGFIGENGAGKTNVLDAVYYLAFCKSRFALPDSQNMRYEAPCMMLQGVFDVHGIEEKIAVGMQRGRKKSVKRGGKEYTRLADHIGLLPVVMVSPDDSQLIDGGSDLRRKFMDGVIAQCDRVYLDKWMRYHYALNQRNALLKQESTDASLYDMCEWQMEEVSGYLYEKRSAFMQEFVPIFAQYYGRVSSGREQVGIRYVSHLQEGSIKQQWESMRERDRIVGFTTKGLHKDDLEMMLGAYSMKKTGSQGQNKTFLVALKLAQYDFLRAAAGTRPILLLDDLFDKLDAGRVEQIVKIVSGEDFGQILITETNRKNLDVLLSDINSAHHIYQVHAGEVQLLA